MRFRLLGGGESWLVVVGLTGGGKWDGGLTGCVWGDLKTVELCGLDETADGGEDAEAHEEAEDDFQAQLDLQVVDDEDGVEREQEVGGCAPGCLVPSLVMGNFER